MKTLLPFLFALPLTACGDAAGTDSALEACDLDAIQAEGQSLRESYASCVEGDACQTVTTGEAFGGDTCLDGYLCAFPLRADVDLAAFAAEAVAVDQALRSCDAEDGTVQECLTECDIDETVPPECNTTTGLCELVP